MPTKRTRKRNTKRGGMWPWTTDHADPALDNIADQIIDHVKDGKKIEQTMLNGVDLKKLKLALMKKIAYFHPHIKGRYNLILNSLDTSFDVSTTWTVTSVPADYSESYKILEYVNPEIRSQKIIKLLKESKNLKLLSEVLDKQLNKEEYDLLKPKFTEANMFQNNKMYDANERSLN